MEGMKKNMMNIIPQTLIMTAINYFFEGFVVSKLSPDHSHQYGYVTYILKHLKGAFIYHTTIVAKSYNSQNTFPADARLPRYVTTRDRRSRYGRDLGQFAIMVFSELFWTAIAVYADSWRGKW